MKRFLGFGLAAMFTVMAATCYAQDELPQGKRTPLNYDEADAALLQSGSQDELLQSDSQDEDVVGTIVVRATPWGVVSVNNARIGNTPITTKLVQPGMVSVRLQLPTNKSVVEREVEVKDGCKVEIAYDFNRSTWAEDKVACVKRNSQADKPEAEKPKAKVKRDSNESKSKDTKSSGVKKRKREEDNTKLLQRGGLVF